VWSGRQRRGGNGDPVFHAFAGGDSAQLWRTTIASPVYRAATLRQTTFRREALEAIFAVNVASNGYSFQIEMVHRARRLGYRVVEVPIRFEDRVAGASKVSRGEVRRALWTVLRLSLGRWKR